MTAAVSPMPRITELKPRVAMLRPAGRRALIVERVRGRALQRMRAETLGADPLCVQCKAEGRGSAPQDKPAAAGFFVSGASPVVDRLRGRAAVAQRARRLSAHPLCARCLLSGRVTAATAVDHIVPLFKGGADTDDNTQSLCTACHRIKTAEDQGYRARHEVGIDGLPSDPSHHWNRRA